MKSQDASRTAGSIFAILLVAQCWILVSDACAQPPPHSWSKRFGNRGEELSCDAAVDARGDVVVVGQFTGDLDFGDGPLISAGSYDVFVAKFDANGSHLWSRSFGDYSIDYGECVAVDGDGNVLVAGSFSGTIDCGGGPLVSAGGLDVFMAKYDRSGAHLWSRVFGDTQSDRVSDIAVSGVGAVVLASQFGGTIDLGGGPLTTAGGYDIFVAMFDPGGGHRWSRSFGGVEWDMSGGVAMDRSGNVVLTGYFTGTVDLGGGPLVGIWV